MLQILDKILAYVVLHSQYRQLHQTGALLRAIRHGSTTTLQLRMRRLTSGLALTVVVIRVVLRHHGGRRVTTTTPATTESAVAVRLQIARAQHRPTT